jgi:hypothetical protein
MLNNAVPAKDAEMQQFQDDLLQSIREFKDGNFACVTQIEPHNVNEYCKPRIREANKSHVVPNNLTADISGKVKRGLP